MLLGAALTLGASQAMALKELDDSSLSKVQGAGLAIGLEDFRYLMAPTSYIELTGNTTGGDFKRGDARYYGLSISAGRTAGSNAGIQQWSGDTGCMSNDLGCPIGEPLNYLAAPSNPYVLRAFEYIKNIQPGDGPNVLNYDGDPSPTTVFELIGPSKTDLWNWAFWGEIEVGRQVDDATSGSNQGVFQNQTFIKGRPVSLFAPPTAKGYTEAANPSAPARLQLLQETQEQTFGIIYHSHLSGDFRFSVAQKTASPDQLGQVPTFDDQEGLYFSKVNAFLPLGQLAYQSITFDDIEGQAGGDFVIELTKIPSDKPAVYNDFYSLAPGDEEGYQRSGRPNRYYKTHGYVQWGVWFPGVSPGNRTVDGVEYSSPSATSTNQGIYFRAPEAAGGGVTNIGTARIDGLLIQHMKITTCGAAPQNCQLN